MFTIMPIIPNYCRFICGSAPTSLDVPRHIVARGRGFSFRGGTCLQSCQSYVQNYYMSERIHIPRRQTLWPEGECLALGGERPAGGRPAAKPLCFSDRGRRQEQPQQQADTKSQPWLFNTRAKERIVALSTGICAKCHQK